jgi:hypothetical protein
VKKPSFQPKIPAIARLGGPGQNPISPTGFDVDRTGVALGRTVVRAKAAIPSCTKQPSAPS